MAKEALELFLLDAGTDVIALGRCGADAVIVRLPFDDRLAALATFRRRVEDAVLGNGSRPTAKELIEFGVSLFDWVFTGKLRDLYALLPSGRVTLEVVSTRPQLMELPWEYMMMPDRRPVPHRERRVVRVLPTCGMRPTVKKLKDRVRVLFVVADPIDQAGIDWADWQKVIEREIRAHLPNEVELKVVEGATRRGLIETIGREAFDVFHFFGHGQVREGVGHLVLTSVNTHKSDYLDASKLATLLSGKDVGLALLSACETAAGNFENDFSVLATTLVDSGIPAVVANQVSIPPKTVSPFIAALYKDLLRGGDIDSAVMEGRVALAVGLEKATGDDATLEWGFPTLYRVQNGAALFTP